MLAHPRQVGAVWPTSRHAVRDLLDLADFESARVVVEFGTGTGVYTREVLERLHPEARFLSFELDPELVTAVSELLEDPRMKVIHDSAENVEDYLGGEEVDVIVCSLPFTSLPSRLSHDILALSRKVLARNGTMLVLQYSTTVLPYLKEYFFPVARRISPLNLPPAFLFACGKGHPDLTPARYREDRQAS